MSCPWKRDLKRIAIRCVTGNTFKRIPYVIPKSHAMYAAAHAESFLNELPQNAAADKTACPRRTTFLRRKPFFSVSASRNAGTTPTKARGFFGLSSKFGRHQRRKYHQQVPSARARLKYPTECQLPKQNERWLQIIWAYEIGGLSCLFLLPLDAQRANSNRRTIVGMIDARGNIGSDRFSKQQNEIHNMDDTCAPRGKKE